MHAPTFLLLAASAVATAQNLTIEITYAANCTRKTMRGDVIDVLYNGTFTNGTLFDSSYDASGKPDAFEFDLGAGMVIPGWDLGLTDMCPGDRRKLTIPPEYGYGSVAVGPIPANSTLVFYTELVGIKNATTRPATK